MALRIDNLKVGQNVSLSFAHGKERAMFAGILGEGDDRRASFVSVDGNSEKIYFWEAYRYNDRWAYGTSAQRLSLLEIL